MRSFLTISWVMTLGVGAAAAQAGQVVNTDAGVQVHLPSSWQVETSDGLVFANDAANNVMMAFITSKYQDLETLLTAIEDELEQYVQNPIIEEKPDVDHVNGLQRIKLVGAAKLDSGPVDLHVTLVVGGARGLIVLTLGQIERMRGEVDDIYTSIERAAPQRSLADSI